MTKKFAERYYQWLTQQVYIEHNGNRPREYDGLFRILHDTEFVWFVPNDDNRIGDAFDLRREFWEGKPIPRKGVSVLEVLIALSRRLEFNADGEKEIWAGQLLKNLGLDKMYDPVTRRKAEKIEEIVNTFIWRTYEVNGQGGLFPLTHIKEDQTKVEIWYQMHAYIIEHTVN